MSNYISSEGEVTSASTIKKAAESIVIKRGLHASSNNECIFIINHAYPWSEDHATFVINNGSKSQFNLSVHKII